METVVFINFPFVITDKGNRYHKDELKGILKIGNMINENKELVGGIVEECST